MSLARLFVACTFTLALVAGCDKKAAKPAAKGDKK